MRNRKISLFQEPNCYAGDYNTDTGRRLLIFLSRIIFAVNKYRKQRLHVFSHCNLLVSWIYSKYVGLIYLDQRRTNLQIAAETPVSQLSSFPLLVTFSPSLVSDHFLFVSHMFCLKYLTT